MRVFSVQAHHLVSTLGNWNNTCSSSTVVGFSKMKMKKLPSLNVNRTLTSKFDILTLFPCYLLIAMVYHIALNIVFFLRNFRIGEFLCFVPHAQCARFCYNL